MISFHLFYHIDVGRWCDEDEQDSLLDHPRNANMNDGQPCVKGRLLNSPGLMILLYAWVLWKTKFRTKSTMLAIFSA